MPPSGRSSPELVTIEKGQQVDIDRGKFARVLLNLLSNAYKFSPQDSAVTVELIGSPTGEPNRHGLRVIDRGIGMSEEEVQHVGKRFYRVDRSGSILGTGLGVSIVKEMLHVMGGSFDLQSRVGEGTQVTLWLRPAQL
jgi:signal transduction histidine kinase